MVISVPETVPDHLRGVSISDKKHPITTIHQLGGSGIVLNKALAIPFHLGNVIRSLEYVSVLAASSVGTHLQETDEIYYLDRGIGELVTNGEACQVREGDLVIAPRGTTHSIRNLQAIQPLSFLVIEVAAPHEPAYAPMVMEGLPQTLEMDYDRYRAVVGQQEMPLRLAVVTLNACFAGPWGELTLLELPPGCRMVAYSLPTHDENLFVLRGHASIEIGELDVPFRTDEEPECGLNILVPAGLGRQITNQSSAEKLLLLSVQIRHGAA
jgi:mannose-6-phosphate isomerase-like protein (cupin superfamily)